MIVTTITWTACLVSTNNDPCFRAISCSNLKSEKPPLLTCSYSYKISPSSVIRKLQHSRWQVNWGSQVCSRLSTTTAEHKSFIARIWSLAATPMSMQHLICNKNIEMSSFGDAQARTQPDALGISEVTSRACNLQPRNYLWHATRQLQNSKRAPRQSYASNAQWNRRQVTRAMPENTTEWMQREKTKCEDNFKDVKEFAHFDVYLRP